MDASPPLPPHPRRQVRSSERCPPLKTSLCLRGRLFADRLASSLQIQGTILTALGRIAEAQAVRGEASKIHAYG